MPQPVLRDGRAADARSASIYFGSTSPAMDEALDDAAAERASTSTRCACAPSRSTTTSTRLHRRARPGVRGRAEPRRAAAHAAGQRTARSTRRKLIPVLHYDGTPITARFITDEIAEQRRRAATSCRCARLRHDLPRQAQAAPSHRCRTTRSATRAATTKARSRRCAPAAATIRSRPRSSRPASSSTSSRTASPSCRASAARRRRRPTSSAPRTASTRVHGRMPSVLTGANLANRDLIYLGVSGDGDSRLDRPRPVRARACAAA